MKDSVPATEMVLTAEVTLDFREDFRGEIILVLACFEDILWELYVVAPTGRMIDRVVLVSLTLTHTVYI